jgi:tetratricopeptide (TPR) repeat protein
MKFIQYSHKVLSFILLLSSSVSWAQTNIEPDPNDPRMTEEDIELEDRFVQAKYLAIIGKTADAIKVMDTIRRAKPKNSTVLFELSKLYLSQKEYNLAETSLKSALEADPSSQVIMEYGASFYKQIGRDLEGISMLNSLIALAPKSSKYYDQLIQAQIRNKDTKSALATAAKWELAVGFSEQTSMAKVGILVNEGNVDGAVQVYDKLIAKYPKEIKYLKEVGALYEASGKKQQAIPYLEKILAIQPDDTNAKLAVMVYTNANIKTDSDFLTLLNPLMTNPEISIDTKVKELIPLVSKQASSSDTILSRDLIKMCNSLIIAHPNDAKAHAIYADVLMNAGNTDAAIIQYEKTLSINKKNYLVWEQLMNGLDRVGNYDQLLKVSNDAVDFFPNNGLSYYFVAKAFAMQKNEKKSTEFLEEASLISAQNEWLNSKIMGLQGYLSFLKGNHTEAIKLLQSSIDMSKQMNGEAYEWLGDVYTSKNQNADAKTAYNKAKSVGSKSKSLMAKLK